MFSTASYRCRLLWPVAVLALHFTWTEARANALNPTPAELDWVRSNAIAFETAEAGRGFADLEPLRHLIGDARIVSLGEGTHGTREFFQMKHRLVEFLASEMGFTLFSIEANMPEAYRMNDYVLHGKGDPRGLLQGMYFWTWNTQEVLDLILWMREFNETGAGPIQFTGFDMQTPHVAMGIVSDFIQTVEPSYADQVAEAYKAAAESDQAGRGAGFGVATGSFPVQAAIGHTVRYSGWIKSENVADGHAGLWWRIDGESGTLGFDNLRGRGPEGTTPWAQYEIELEVPAEAININFGALLTGSGTAWFDGLEIELDGKPFDASDLFECDFESGTARGYYTGGRGYEVLVDDSQAHSGGCCLRMKEVGTPDQEQEGSPEIALRRAAQHCRDVLDHLQSKRRRYKEKLPEAEVTWAIQNARVAWQAYAARAGQTQRDESMAENVRWIIDQAPPDTRVILWAHNGHVARASGDNGYIRMGSYLSEWYGDDMVVLGFAGHEGKYTAVELNKGLGVHDLLPSSQGCVEYVFHQTGLPRFILDLRRASPEATDSAWLTRSALFRSIGSMAGDTQFHPCTVSDEYDALVYFDQTQATDCFSLPER